MTVLYAHSISNAAVESWEPLQLHLASVAATCHGNAGAFGSGAVGEIAGWLHDLGKVKPAFQEKLRGAQNRVGHSGEGARYCTEHYGKLGKLLAYGIAGHHAGLANGLGPAAGKPATPLHERLDEAEALEPPPWLTLPPPEMPAPLAGPHGAGHFQRQFFTRMLFSALVDADFVETERFYTTDAPRGGGDLVALRDSLHAGLTSSFGPPETEVNGLRAEVLAAAGERAVLPPGMFSLTVPTGGGKTLASPPHGGAD